MEFKEAIKNLPYLGKLLADYKYQELWEKENAFLPKVYVKKRKKYREFAKKYLEPYVLEADRDPYNFDKTKIFIEAGKRGFLSEFLPFPFGRFPYRALKDIPGGIVLLASLKAEEFCSVDAGLGLALLANDLGLAPLLLSGKIKDIIKFLIPAHLSNLRGKPYIAAFAITEPGAGSDVEDSKGAKDARLMSIAKSQDKGFILNGRKVFISDGGVAKIITVFAALDEKRVENWTCFLVREEFKGFSRGRREKKLGQRAADATELIFEDLFVPKNYVVGKKLSGWAINKNVLNYSRIPVGAIALGIARGAFEKTLDFVMRYKFNGKRLIEYQKIQLELADMLHKLMIGRYSLWQIAKKRIPFEGFSSAIKVFNSDNAVEISLRCMDILGNHSVLSRNHVEKSIRDARLTQIYEGTNQINRLAIFESFLERYL